MSVKKNGFALIEVIISIVVLASVLAGATSLIWAAANAVERNQDRLTATYLAQECLELARNARDSAWRHHLPWDCAFTNDCPNISGPAQDIIPVQDIMGEETLIEILGEHTKFNRKMELTILPDQIAVTCKVYWPRKSGTEYVYLDEILTNWRKI